MRKQVVEFLETRVLKDLRNLDEEGAPFFDLPLVRFASLDDPLFDQFQSVIGPFHKTPRQWLEEAFPGAEAAVGTVICWALPIILSTRESNRREDIWPSRAWARTRQFGEAFNVSLRKGLVDWLSSEGCRAIAPQLLPGWQEVASPSVGVASNWSERHAAYAAGLGTFSLNDALITERGIAHRLGSVVTDLVLDPDPRPYPDHLSNCLYHRNRSCGACVKRCPVGALSLQGHDKVRCMEYVYDTVVSEKGSEYGVTTSGCGLCQTRVPCENCIP